MATNLKEELKRAEDVLAQLKSRYYLLHAFQNAFTPVTGRRQIPIHNDHVWRMVFDTRDALALHLASWAKGMVSPGGLFGQLKANLGKLYVPRPKAKTVGGGARREVFERLFPRAVARSKVLASDVDELSDKFALIVARVRNDRDLTLAHMYEKNAKLSRRLLTPRGYATVFLRLERLLNDVRTVVDDSSRTYSDQSWADSKVVAEDLVDMIVCGTVSQMLNDFGVLGHLENAQAPHLWQLREEFYSKRRRSINRKVRVKRAG